MLWIFVISIPIMGLFRSLFVSVFVLTGLLVFNLFIRKKPLVHKPGFHWAPAGVSSAGRYAWIFALAAAIILPMFLNSYSLDVFTSALFYTMLALGLNLLVGDLGLLNLGYIAFYGIGAYTYAILSTKFGIGFWGSLMLGGIAASVFSLIVAIPTLRLKGDYLAIATLGFGEIVRIVLNNWDSLTNGPNGIMNIPRPSLPWIQLSTGIRFFYLVLFFVILQVYILYRIKRSRFGRYAVAIRENEQAAEMVAINTYKIKTIYFMLSAFFGGIAGVMFASKQMFVSPDSFTFIESVYVLAMVILGGMGNIAGVILGAFTLVILPELLREFVLYRMLIFALLLITMMLFKPEGLLGKRT
jgi:branched-chain amino acid transport system permease protein